MAHLLSDSMPDHLPLPVLEGDHVVVVYIPRLSKSAFDHLKDLLILYEPAIVRETMEVPDPDALFRQLEKHGHG